MSSGTTHLKLVKYAILSGDKPKILRLLQRDHVDLKGSNKNGDTLLHFMLKYASRFSETQIIEILNNILRRGVDINIKNNEQETVLHLAIAKQLEHVLNFLLKHATDNDVLDIKGVNKNGDTLIHFVLKYFSTFSESQTIQILNNFISRGIDVNVKNNAQETVLHLAIAEQSERVVIFLLKHAIDINVMDDEGNSVVHYFMKKLLEESETSSQQNYGRKIFNEVSREHKESLNFVEFLLSNGFNIDEKNKKGQSALHLAIEYNLQHILPTLLKHTNDINFASEGEQRTLLHLFLSASHKTNPQFSELSKYTSKYIARSGRFPKQLAIEIVTILLERGVSVDHEDRDGLTALHMAMQFEEQEIVELLLDRFTKVKDECGNKLINEVIEKATWGLLPQEYYLQILSALIARGADVNFEDEQGMTPVYHAVKHKNLGAVELMRQNCSVNFRVKTKKGNNLLHALTGKNVNHPNHRHEETLFDILMSERCQVNGKNKEGQTPLHVAADNNNIDIARKLVARGADVHCLDCKKGLRPLHIAARRGSVEMTRLLLDNGARINDRNRSGETALHAAVASISKRELFQVLLERKAEVNARDHRGDSTLAKNLRVNHIVGIEELLAHGADVNDFAVIRAVWDCRRNRAGRFMAMHWLKLKAARLPYSERCHFIIENGQCERFYNICLGEILLKRTHVDGRTTLYDWLRMQPSRRYVYNEKLRNIVESPTIEKQFPQYASVILGKYRETLARKPLLEPAKEAWLKFTEIHLPIICLEHILAYLNTGDLFAMTEMLSEPVRS